MFETLEPPEQIVAHRWPLLTYGIYSLAGLVFAILGVRRHGFSQPVSLAIACVMFFLSLTWLVTTLRSRSPLTNRKVGFRNILLLLLLMAHQVPPLFHQ
jgi:hypothetical protein